jgi:hypothetical protein
MADGADGDVDDDDGHVHVTVASRRGGSVFKRMNQSHCYIIFVFGICLRFETTTGYLALVRGEPALLDRLLAPDVELDDLREAEHLRGYVWGPVS